MLLSPKQEAELWHIHAERDLGFARLGIEMGFYSQTCFMVHQSAEKALKALLYLRGVRYIVDTPVSDLLQRVADVHSHLNRYETMVSRLDQWYQAARYLGRPSGDSPYQTFSEADAVDAVGEGENLMLEVRNIIRLAR